MRSSRHSIPASPNAFSHAFLQRLGERDEPPTAGEADAAGPWHVEEVPGGFGLFRLGESQERGFEPYAVFRDRWLALLAAAVLPGTGRDPAVLLARERDAEGFAVTEANGAILGHVALFDEFFVDALNVAAGVVRLPGALASLLEAAGQVSLERAGAILDEKIS